MKETDKVWIRVQETATALGVRGELICLADARFAVLSICREEQIELAPSFAVEYLAAELVRLNVEAHAIAQQRLNLRSAC
jgi:hypothetical protein